jgi:uncharacterized protein (TIGR03083 family)
VEDALNLLIDDLVEAGHLVSEMLRRVPAADAPATADWNAGQVAVHLLAGARMYAGCLAGRPSPLQDLQPSTQSAFNDGAYLVACRSDLSELADGHVDAIREVCTVAAAGDLGRLVPFHGGTTATAEFLLRAMTWEQLLHGWDLASSCDSVWAPPPELAARSTRFFADLGPLLLRRDAREAAGGIYRFEPDEGDAWPLSIGSSAAASGAASRFIVAGDGMDMLLWTSRRVGWEDLRLTASGAEPELASSFMHWFGRA